MSLSRCLCLVLPSPSKAFLKANTKKPGLPINNGFFTAGIKQSAISDAANLFGPPAVTPVDS